MAKHRVKWSIAREQIIRELLPVSAAVWEFALSCLGKWFTVFNEQRAMMKPQQLVVRISIQRIVSNDFQYCNTMHKMYSDNVVKLFSVLFIIHDSLYFLSVKI